MSADDLRLLFLLLALAFFIYLGIRRIQHRRASRSWPTVTGVAGSATIKLTKRGTHPMFLATVNYSYVVGAEPYKGWFIRWFILHGRAETWIAKYPEGAPLLIRYNPKKPLESVVFEKEQAGDG